MSKISLTPNAAGTGNFTIASPATNTDRTLTLPDESGTVLAASAATLTVLNATTHKIAVNIDGTIYYLLASTSGA